MKQKLRRVIIGVAFIFACGAGLAKATLIAYDDFEYSGTDVKGQSGGTGWGTNVWAGTGNSTLSTNSLLFNGIDSIGGSIGNITTGSTGRVFSNGLDLNNGTYYLGVLLAKTDAASLDLLFNTGTNADRWRMRWGSSETLSFGVSLATATTVGTYSFTNTLFVVMKYAGTTNTDTISIKVFLPGDTITEPVTWDATTTGATGEIVDRFRANGSVAGGKMDAVRIGTTFQDVIPEPVTAGMLGIGAVLLLLFRRRFHIGC